MAAASPSFAAAETTCDDVCFWLYSSGSTGAPKGTVHLHSSLDPDRRALREPILGIREDDVVFSAAKLFFAYGLGNALTFPLAVGATTVLMAERPTPAGGVRAPARSTGRRSSTACRRCSPRCSRVPMLPQRDELALRRCASAGEALPADIGKRWTERFGVEILDGLGSTEMLHIFLSNRPGDVRYGTTGTPVPGYELRIVDDDGDAGRRRARSASCRSTGRPPRWLLEQPRQDARHVPGAVDAQRRQVLDRRGRLLRLLRPQRRHAQGRRHLRVADRGRGGADHASGRARSRGGRPRGRRRADQAAWRTSC